MQIKLNESKQKLFNTHNDKKIKWQSSSLQGYIDIDYKTLVKVLGKPFVGDDYKSDAEWEIEFFDGTVATIYNYKNGINYNGKEEGTPKTKITEWHIGGSDQKAVNLVHLLFYCI